MVKFNRTQKFIEDKRCQIKIKGVRNFLVLTKGRFFGRIKYKIYD